MSEAEEVGSVSEEAWKLWCALSSSEHGTSAAQTSDPSDAFTARRAQAEGDGGEPHSCPTGWCPICQVAGFVREHPEAVARVGASAASLLRSLRELMATPQPRGEQDPR